MSTRATYRVKEYGNEGSLLQHFYIHHDGYPEGAAEYFKELVSNLEKLVDGPLSTCTRCRPGKVICAFGMINGAEFTGDHFSHGDTEYCYDIFLDKKEMTFGIRAYTKEYKFMKLFFDDTLDKFIEKYGACHGETETESELLRTVTSAITSPSQTPSI